MKYMPQLTTIAPATNKPKHIAPNRIIIFGSARCVIPNTTEANSAYSSSAGKCVIYRPAFRPFASDCASTAAITFSKPATTANLLP
jgi:hypothetical protein